MVAAKMTEWNALAKSLEDSKATPTALSRELITAICSARLYSWMKSDDEDRSTGLTQEELQACEDFCLMTDTAMRAALARGPESGHWVEVVDVARDWAWVLGYELDVLDGLFPDFIRDFAKVESQASQSISKRNIGLDAPTPSATCVGFTSSLHTA